MPARAGWSGALVLEGKAGIGKAARIGSTPIPNRRSYARTISTRKLGGATWLGGVGFIGLIIAPARAGRADQRAETTPLWRACVEHIRAPPHGHSFVSRGATALS
jgi:hypothetical protein